MQMSKYNKVVRDMEKKNAGANDMLVIDQAAEDKRMKKKRKLSIRDAFEVIGAV